MGNCIFQFLLSLLKTSCVHHFLAMTNRGLPSCIVDRVRRFEYRNSMSNRHDLIVLTTASYVQTEDLELKLA